MSAEPLVVGRVGEEPSHYQASTPNWLPIPGLPGYEASSDGQIRSLKRGAPRLLTPCLNDRGYLQVSARLDGRGKTFRVHRVVAAAFLGPRPAGMEVRHLDGDQTNNRVSNLAYGTHSENVADQVRHGRHAYARRTHCDRGHRFEQKSSEPRRRRCMECRRIRERDARRKRLAS